MAKIGSQAPRRGMKQPRIAPNGNRLPDPLPNGVILTDVIKRQWKLGKSIGLGGFGEIYLASDDIKKRPGLDAKYVIKVEPHTNGPLFSEMHFYHRVGKSEQIEEWMRKKKLSFLGMPKFIGSGSHEHRGIKYRFMVMERFGEDLQKLLDRNNKVFPLKTVYTLGKMVLDILEYIHSHGYIHADVKASNLLLGYGPGKENEVYLIDFGLACRYITNGQHKELKEDRRKAHDGTIEFTSRDAHIGAHSRRGDLEILGYNMLQWLCGRLPWEDNLKDPESVSRQKSMYMSNISSLIKSCYPKRAPPRGIAEYFTYVAGLTFEEEPDYKYCRNILSAAIKASGFIDDGLLVFTSDNIIPIARKGVKRPAEGGSLSFSPQAKSKKIHEIPSENNGSSPLPQRKLRRVASATQSMQSSSLEHSNNSNSFSVLENPTPAMLLVMQRNLERQMQLSHLNGHIDKNGLKGNFFDNIKSVAEALSSVQKKKNRNGRLQNGFKF
ncbi:serine/threonine-protein kinase VRK1-like isoform X2 [Argiope bruennichi]|uniref:non-specific serine/threonine protein kinase n=1 Tax=Argiope bruennichi TaxID=94029 RepID=A0A8T0E6Q0_ARGBR|nr:serine/threonine-protein kinase VRK1-like isoform X2 [Argiope bruennichi]KAF8764884.1 Serine/threonine-protein kinase VRK1 like protein [Argiope bruennichi]